jgi:hypothetical protein
MDIGLLRDKHTTGGAGTRPSPSGPEDQGGGPERRELEARLRTLHEQLGHGHPDALVVEMELGLALYGAGLLDRSRMAFEQVLAYRAVLDGEHGVPTAIVARGLFRVLCELDDRAAMAEVYYRFLSWIPMRDPASLCSELRAVSADVEELLASST